MKPGNQKGRGGEGRGGEGRGGEGRDVTRAKYVMK